MKSTLFFALAILGFSVKMEFEVFNSTPPDNRDFADLSVFNQFAGDENSLCFCVFLDAHDVGCAHVLACDYLHWPVFY